MDNFIGLVVAELLSCFGYELEGRASESAGQAAAILPTPETWPAGACRTCWGDPRWPDWGRVWCGRF